MEINREKTINLIINILSKVLKISNEDMLYNDLSQTSDKTLIKIQSELASFLKNNKINDENFINKLEKIKNNFDEEIEKKIESEKMEQNNII